MTNWPYEFFSPDEFDSPEKMSRELLAMLDRARSRAGIPFVITSSYRHGDPLSHGEGLAVDISCEKSFERFLIVSSLLDSGFSRVGIYPRHVHADISKSLPQCVLFIGGQ